MFKKSLLIMLLMAIFAPWAAMGQSPLTIGDGTSYSPTGSSAPTATTNGAGSPMGNTYYYCSTAQFIYTAEELGTAKTINSVAFYHNDQTLVGTVKIYLFHTTESTVNTSSYVTSGTPLYTGTNITLGGSSEGWQTFTLETPFEYNGIDNLLVVVCRTKRSDATSGAFNTSLAWQYTSTSENYRYMMRSNDTESNVALSNTTTAYVQSYYRPNIQIEYELPSDCEKPDTFEASDVTHNSATLTWSGGSGTYNVEVKGGEWADWTEILHETTFTTKNLEGLTMVTDYQARIQSVCTNEPSGWKTTSFSTICGPIPVGYKCGFEGPNTGGTSSNPLPACWNRVGTSSYYPYVYTSYPRTDSYCLYFYGSSSTNAIAQLPEIEGGVNGKRLTFYARFGSTSYTSLSIGYMDGTNFVEVQPYTPTASSTYLLVEVDYANIASNPTNMAIKFNCSSTSYSYSIYLDDIELKTIPTCFRPTMLTTVTDKGATTATVSWTAGSTDQDHWDVYYCSGTNVAPSATTTPNVTNTADNPCTLTGLQPTTTYYVYVRGNCGTEEEPDYSEWSTNYCTFTTTVYCADMQVQANTITIPTNTITYNSAVVNWTEVGGATQWKVQCSLNSSFDPIEDEAIVNTNTATLNNLTADKTHYVRIAPYCTENSDFNPWSSNKTFSTPESCPAPVLAAATNTTAHGATLNWTGTSGSYDVRYRTAAYTEGLVEEFGTSLPTGWTNGSGVLNTETGTANITSGSNWSFGTNCGVFDNHAYFNMYNTKNNWLITPQTAIGANYPLSFDVAYTGYDNYGNNIDPTADGPHKLYVLISTDEKAHWTILREYNNTGSEYVLDDISKTGQTVSDISLAAYAGKNAYIAFLGVSSTQNYDNNIHIDNVTIGSGISHEAGEWANAVTGITANTVVLDDDTKFESETIYDLKLVGHCPWTGEETESNTVQFTTASSCETPTNLAKSEVTANSAKISWDGHGLTAFNLRYGTDGENWTTVENVANPYTLDGVLTGNTEYQVQAQGICTEGTTDWSTSLTFTTECGPISVATEAYQYDFETTLKWNCWTVLGGSPAIQNTTSSGYTHSGTHYLRFTGSYRNIVSLPEFVETTSSLQINFWVRPEDYSNNKCGSFDIGYLTNANDTSTFVKLERYEYNDWDANTYREKTVYFDGAPDDARIAFRQNANATNYYFYIDDVEVSLAPVCRPVKNLASSNVTNYSATITWTKGTEDQDAWQLKYNKTEDFDPDTEGTLVDNLDATTYTFDKTLDAASVYYIYVRANCGGEAGNSPWTKTTISTGAAAPAPTAFNKKEVGPDWVDLYWTAPAGDRLSGYGIYYSTTDAAPTGETEATVTIDNPTAPTAENPYRLPDLENEETYYLWIRANHETGVYSSWVALSGSSITTLVACPVPTTLTATNIANTTANLSWTGSSAILEGDGYTVEYCEPAHYDVDVTEDFSGVTAVGYNASTYYLPDGWKSYNSDPGYVPRVSNASSYDDYITALTGNFLLMTYNKNGQYAYAIMPKYSSISSVEFNYVYEGTTHGELTVGYVTNNTGYDTYVPLQTPEKKDTKTNFTLSADDIATINTNNGYIAFRYEGNGTTYYSVGIDDIVIKGGEYHAATAWQAAVTGYTESFTYQLTGLAAGTKYDVRVYSGCTEAPDTENATTTINTLPFTKTIAKHGENIEDGGWYLIASPVVEAITPSANNGFITSTSYDLYRFNQAPTANSQDEYLEWENYKSHTTSFAIESGKGYLYASGEENGTELKFIGTPYSGNGEVSLTYSTANPDSRMHGWNLIGNPFGTAATLDLPYYQMNEGRTALEAKTEGNIPAMEGVFVYAYDQATSQAIATTQFTPASRSAHAPQGIMNISVLLNRGAEVDNAIIRFDEGHTLPKFYFMEQNANLYIPQNGKEYAIVTSEGQGEMPLNFRANKNGSYTLSFGSENVSFSYLHLIDNKTGNDIDLLQTPSYTFNATTTDYESRFKLVFAAGASISSETFAFFSNGNWLIANEGKATLQVVDVMGRILSSETINGSVSKAINAVPGVYMLRLVNGNDVKTQKVVVR